MDAGVLQQYWVHACLVCCLAVGVDRLFGEPAHHPLVWFGNFASRVEGLLNRSPRRRNGVVALLLTVSVPVALCAWLQHSIEYGSLLRVLLDTLILAFVIGWQSMKEHARAVSEPLLRGDLAQSREQLARIVSRDTRDMDAAGISGSTLESVLENGNDCLFASLFWYLLLGPAGALAHRLINTLDAMWGYRNQRYLEFGWCAARLDDLLGWPTARLTALTYAVCGHPVQALRCWRSQAPLHKSPNAGLVMAAGGGALGLTYGGPMPYHGRREDKPWLGEGPPAGPDDIARAIALIDRGILLWLGVLAAIAMVTFPG